MDDFDAARELDLRRAEARRAVDEAGGGESEGFELAEEELIDHASHGDEHSTSRILQDSVDEGENGDAIYGEADEEHKPD